MKKLTHRRLAEGEATGHFHEAVNAVLYGNDEEPERFEAPCGTDVTHQEHDTVSLPPNNYTRSIVQEYDHVEEEAKDVVD